MLNLFKKPDEPKTDGASLGAPLAQVPVFEDGKERTFKDPKTGEFVSQRALSPENRKLLMEKLQKNGGQATQTIQLFRQILALMKTAIKLDDDITVSEKEINETMNKIRDDMKLDRRWGLNPQLMILEKRESPDA